MTHTNEFLAVGFRTGTKHIMYKLTIGNNIDVIRDPILYLPDSDFYPIDRLAVMLVARVEDSFKLTHLGTIIAVHTTAQNLVNNYKLKNLLSELLQELFLILSHSCFSFDIAKEVCNAKPIF